MPARSEPYDAPAIITFAKELTAWREGASLSKKELGDALGYADSYIGQVEHCKNIPSEEFADALDTYFNTNGLFHRLWQRIIETRRAVSLPPGFAEYLEVEGESEEIHKFDALIVTGLLQTEDYARSVLLAFQPAEAVEPLLAKRMRRQAILTRENAPRLFIIHDERALRTMVGGGEVMREQLKHILEMSRRGNIQHQVVPQDTGAYAGVDGSLTLLSLGGGKRAAYVEAQGEGQLIDDPVRVANCAVRFNLLRGYALRVPETDELVESMLESL